MKIKHTVLLAFASSVVALHAQEHFVIETKDGPLVAMARMPIASKLVTGAPYSAEIVSESIQTLGDGNRIIRRSTGRVYRDSEGRVRREEDRASGSTSISITDPTTGSAFSLDPEQRIAWKTRGPAMQLVRQKIQDLEAAHRRIEEAKIAGEADHHKLMERRLAEERRGEAQHKVEAVARLDGARVGGGRVEQTVSEKLPDRVIEGVRVEGRRRTTTIAAGSIGNQLPIVTISEEWSSPDLQVLVMTVRKDPREGDSTYQLNQIIRAEPDRSLFLVPSDYTVTEPGGRGGSGGRGGGDGRGGFKIVK